MDDREKLLQELLSLHRFMLECAQEGKWAEVVEGEKNRQERLKEFFRDPVSPEQMPAVRSALETMLLINDSLMTLAKKDRSGIGQDLGSIQKGRRAVAAYGQNSGSLHQPAENAPSG